jgi:hypothetical protein
MRPHNELEIFNIIVSHANMQIAESRMQEFKTVLAQHPSVEVAQGILNYVNSVNTQQGQNLID